MIDAIRERERRKAALADEISELSGALTTAVRVAGALPDLRRRMRDWRAVLAEETTQARQMLRKLLTGRLVFTARPETQEVEFAGRGDLGQLFAGVLPKLLASPTGDEQIWIAEIHRVLRLAA
jgi:hypothetical protein